MKESVNLAWGRLSTTPGTTVVQSTGFFSKSLQISKLIQFCGGFPSREQWFFEVTPTSMPLASRGHRRRHPGDQVQSMTKFPDPKSKFWNLNFFLRFKEFSYDLILRLRKWRAKLEKFRASPENKKYAEGMSSENLSMPPIARSGFLKQWRETSHFLEGKPRISTSGSTKS